MRRIVHLSDLHFGWNEAGLVESLRTLVEQTRPDLTVVSGDLVEHATRAEFEQARSFVQSLSGPLILVPGNHDLPFYNFYGRLVHGLSLYREFITRELSPFFADAEMAVMGINTARLWPVRNGSINARQVRQIKDRFCALPPGVARILVTHHPFNLPADFSSRHLVKHGAAALTSLAGCLDVLLAGHMHLGASGRVADRLHTPNGALVFVQAGTAISKRYKGEQNSFNMIEVDGRELRVEKYTWNAGESAYQARPGGVKAFTLQ